MATKPYVIALEEHYLDRRSNSWAAVPALVAISSSGSTI